MVWGVSSKFSTKRVDADYFQWFICCVFLVFVAMAMAELGSAAPTAGGLYYWTFKYSSPRFRKLLSWLIGCELAICLKCILMTYRDTADVNTSAYVAGMASVDWGCATQLVAAVNIGSGGAFKATNVQTL